MKKAIILDVDGVIIGEEKGVNTPHPNPAVTNKLAEVTKQGIPIILCTARPAFAMEDEIQNLEYNTPHIADGGSLLVDKDGKVFSEKVIDSEVAKNIVKTCLMNDVYVEVYSATDYYIQSTQNNSEAEEHAKILLKHAVVVNDLARKCDELNITKILFTVADESKKIYGESLMSEFSNDITLVWTTHMPMLPLQFSVITAQGISKKQAFLEIARHLGIPPQNFLGVGDSTSDWAFIEHCGYGGAVGNASDELKTKVRSKGDKGFVGGHINENGVIGIIDWFLEGNND